jgi:hypothetical protein
VNVHRRSFTDHGLKWRVGEHMSAATEREMQRIIDCWALAERAQHLCAFETLGINYRCRKPSQEEVRKAWRTLSTKIHPDRNADCSELATMAMRCVNLAKQHLFEHHFGYAEARVRYKREPDKAAVQAREAAEEAAAAEAAEAAECTAEAERCARLAASLLPRLSTDDAPREVSDSLPQVPIGKREREAVESSRSSEDGRKDYDKDGDEDGSSKDGGSEGAIKLPRVDSAASR